jgi:hypothetical protein
MKLDLDGLATLFAFPYKTIECTMPNVIKWQHGATAYTAHGFPFTFWVNIG